MSAGPFALMRTQLKAILPRMPVHCRRGRTVSQRRLGVSIRHRQACCTEEFPRKSQDFLGISQEILGFPRNFLGNPRITSGRKVYDPSSEEYFPRKISLDNFLGKFHRKISQELFLRHFPRKCCQEFFLAIFSQDIFPRKFSQDIFLGNFPGKFSQDFFLGNFPQEMFLGNFPRTFSQEKILGTLTRGCGQTRPYEPTWTFYNMGVVGGRQSGSRPGRGGQHHLQVRATNFARSSPRQELTGCARIRASGPSLLSVTVRGPSRGERTLCSS